jgi:hypothetical protein
MSPPTRAAARRSLLGWLRDSVELQNLSPPGLEPGSLSVARGRGLRAALCNAAREACTTAEVGAPYKPNPVKTHSLKPPGFIPLNPIK